MAKSMSEHQTSPPARGPAGTDDLAEVRARPLWRQLVRLARPVQWSKGVFVGIGPLYGWMDGQLISWWAVLFAFIAFGLASSGCYVINDIRDREADAAHPRKRRRPIASGAVSVRLGWWYAGALYAASAVFLLGVWLAGSGTGAGLLALALGAYTLNVTAYSLFIKHVVVLDVISLASGFVLRVLGGCAAVGVEPSTWLLNCTLFLAMFLAFGKRLGERRTMDVAESPELGSAGPGSGVEGNGEGAAAARAVQSIYTDHLLRMLVVMTAVSTLVIYAGYVQGRETDFLWGFNLLWLTIVPATYGLFRTVVLLERGVYDDPTELATRDGPFQASVVAFGVLTAGVMLLA